MQNIKNWESPKLIFLLELFIVSSKIISNVIITFKYNLHSLAKLEHKSTQKYHECFSFYVA